MELTERNEILNASLERIGDECLTFRSGKKNIGLYGGKAGLVLFYAYLYRQTGCEHHFEAFSRLLDECILSVNAITLSGTFVSGVSGIGWLIRHLVNLGVLDESSVELLDDVEPHILQSLEVDLLRKDYEIFTGVAGKGLYFLEGPMTPTAKKGIERILEILQEGAVIDDDGMAWLKKSRHSDEFYYDLGIPHGIPGIILLLCRVSETNIERDLVLRMIDGAASWVLSKECHKRRGYFPHIAGREFIGRLAWCYGDLGVGAALLAASETLSSPALKEKAMMIFSKEAEKDISSANVFRHRRFGIHDRGLCHGTAGIALFFTNMYKKTGMAGLRDAADYWTNYTLSIKKTDKKQGVGGYLFPGTDPDNNWIKNPYLLEGTIGVGLFYLSMLNEAQTSWERLFMLQ
jgi:lantibiotic modifying enzyme